MSKLLKIIKSLPKEYFSFQDLRKISNLGGESLKVSLSRAIKAGEIVRLAKGLYTADSSLISWENLAVNIYSPSYVSFESALNYYNILSQQAAGLTLATDKRAKEFNIHGQIIAYRHIKPDLLWGYKKVHNFLLAEPEKAFLDLAYLSLNGYGYFDLEEMNLKLLDRQKLKKYLKKFKNVKLNILIGPVLS